MKKYDKLKFKHSQNDGVFDWGTNRSELFERFYNTDEILDYEVAESEFIMIIREDKEFIDAYNSLAWLQMEEYNYGSAQSYFSEAYEIGNSLIPKEFRGKIEWGHIDNRPFLRSIHGLGLSFLLVGEFQQAQKFFEQNLEYNPNDNQGIRSLLIQSYIACGEFKKILNVCHLFPDDILADTLYGKVLALFSLNKIEEAQITLEKAFKYSPLIAKELISKKHKPVLNNQPGIITVGGQDEAYEYWKRMGQYWTNPNIIEFLKNGINK
ncbi:MAG: hypothetical protein KDC52_06670 [Ignavibacteriae bacterium]|nr:hypothetical protein [Ignavibacteriota bacterium]MCB0751138.1 hypothetical protein [Ignavibacteriota bacterium]